MTTSTAALLIVAVPILYLALGRGFFAAFGRITKSPISYKAMRSTAKGSVSVGEADILTGFFWLIMLIAWPLVIGLAIYASLRKRITRKDVTVAIGGVDLSTAPKDPQDD